MCVCVVCVYRSNIKEGSVESGDTLVPYLPPLPLHGLGYQRYCFVLCLQLRSEPIASVEQLTLTNERWGNLLTLLPPSDTDANTIESMESANTNTNTHTVTDGPSSDTSNPLHWSSDALVTPSTPGRLLPVALSFFQSQWDSSVDDSMRSLDLSPIRLDSPFPAPVGPAQTKA